jgi:hypothetical protein
VQEGQLGGYYNGDETLGKNEYKNELHGPTQLLDPSNPLALNFADEQSVKTFTTHQTGGTNYLAQIPASLGDTTYMPGDNKIDSQESDLFEPLDDDNFVDDPFGNADGNIITNLTFITNDSTKKDVVAQDNKDNEEMAEKEDNVVVLSSPWKIICKATKFTEISPEPSEGQQELIHGMLRKWADT